MAAVRVSVLILIKGTTIFKRLRQIKGGRFPRLLFKRREHVLRGTPMQLPHAFKRIRLNLARSKEFPEGSPQHGYEFVAPIDGNGHIDSHLWQQFRDHCRVRRFWNGADEQIGRLVHKPGGAEHARWVFDYDPNRADDDE